MAFTRRRCCSAPHTSHAQEVKTTAGAEPPAGGAAFKFDSVPAPFKSDAAAKAKVALVDGTRDRAGGDVTVLTDGTVPRVKQPAARQLLFAAGSDGGGSCSTSARRST